MHIVFIAGTRPEYLKIIPVYKIFKQDSKWRATFVVTGQHDSMISQLYDFFGIRPDYDLAVMQPGQSLEALTMTLIDKLSELFADINPDYILVQGDTTTTFTASLAAYYRRIKIIHLEAGLRTQNKFAPFPEEINRRLTSVVADYHFCPTEQARQNLLHENIRDNIHIVGNTILDTLNWTLAKIRDNESIYTGRFKPLLTGYNKMVLVTAHRRESFGSGLRAIAKALATLATEYPQIVFVFPVHLNPQVKKLMESELGNQDNIKLLPPQDYDNMVYLMSKAALLMTDSGGIQEEAPTLRKKVLVMRTTTERPEAVAAGFSVLCGTDSQNIIKQFAANITSQPPANSVNPYGDGRSTRYIKEIMDKAVN